MEEKEPIKGAEFLIKESVCADIYTPEDYTEEQRMIAQMCLDFIRQEIEPDKERIESMEEGLMQQKIEKAGELGVLGMSVPAELGGMGVDFPTTLSL
jgi:alkylation response protein AidB-like acyl-CoA dehydrogenase